MMDRIVLIESVMDRINFIESVMDRPVGIWLNVRKCLRVSETEGFVQQLEDMLGDFFVTPRAKDKYVG